MNLSEIKSYLRIDYSSEDTDVQFAYDTAVAFAYEKTGVQYISGDKLYEQLLKFLTQLFFDERESLSEKTKVENDFTITSLIKTIETRGEYIAPVPEEETEENEQAENELIPDGNTPAAAEEQGNNDEQGQVQNTD